ncbi:MAG: hypothetical protein LBJ82_05055 [Deltaproteobacteria bacterium]|nr:hypothetical protein [Deltaproteobacteria bacterium]
MVIIETLGLPKAQHNERSTLCLLALCDSSKEFVGKGVQLVS